MAHGQGTDELCSGTTAGAQPGQGATEYLVLLAVVLIVALVSVALLGFFPGMASDAQITQSQMYWQSATPIAIVESAATTYSGYDTMDFPYLRIRNTGAYPLRVTGIVTTNGKATQFFGAGWFAGSGCGVTGAANIADYYYLAPGEELYFGVASMYNLPCHRFLADVTGATGAYSLGGASSICQNSTTSPGFLNHKTFGFEYIEYVDNQQITKREIGKELVIRCKPPPY